LPLSAETVRANYERIRGEVGDDGDALTSFLDEVRGRGVDVHGLMTMPPFAEDPEASRPYFRRLRELAGVHGLQQLSMGTSQDYRVAADEGATLVRVGSVLYGR